MWTRISEGLGCLQGPRFESLDARSVRERCNVLEKRFKKESSEDVGASGTSPKEDGIFEAIRDIVEQFDEALSLQQEAVSEKSKRRFEEALQAKEMRNVSLESYAETQERRTTEERKTRKVRGT